MQHDTILTTVCARQYGVPVNTLRPHAKNMVHKPSTSLLGRTSVLGEAAEKELVEYILTLEDKGFGLTPKDIRSLAYSYVKQNDVATGKKENPRNRNAE